MPVHLPSIGVVVSWFGAMRRETCSTLGRFGAVSLVTGNSKSETQHHNKKQKTISFAPDWTIMWREIDHIRILSIGLELL